MRSPLQPGAVGAVDLSAPPAWCPGMERRAHRLWVEDGAYAERRYALCTGNV